MQNIYRVRYLALLVALFAVSFFLVRNYKAGQLTSPQEPLPSSATTVTITQQEASDHLLGKIDAPYTLIYYFDYDCPYCVQSLATINAMVKKYPSVRVIVRQLPLTELHPTAFKKAALAECLTKTGEDFFTISSRLFQKQGVAASALSLTDLGISSQTKLNTCLAEQDAQASVLKMQRSALNLGLYTTPSIALTKDGLILTKANYVSAEKLENALKKFVGDTSSSLP